MENWIEQNYEKFKNRKITNIIVPGTHDSQSYRTDLNVSISGFWIDFGSKIGSKNKFVRNIINSWTITQEHDIYNQLLAGIRSFDIRVSFSIKHNEYYVTHTFVCETLKSILTDIKLFMERYPKEFLILRFARDFAHRETITEAHKNEIYGMIKNYIGKYLIKPDKKIPTLKEAYKNNKRIILYFYDYKNTYIWQNYKNPWLNTSDVDEKYNFLLDNLDVMSSRHINMLSFTLTPQQKDVTDNIKYRIFGKLMCCNQQIPPNSTEDLTLLIQRKFKDYFVKLIENNPKKLNKLSCIVTDFPSDEFIETVINFNHLILI